MRVVGQREPCPCGSGRRYKACHGRSVARGGDGHGDGKGLAGRPFAGLGSEAEWVALREVVPAATAPVRLAAQWHDGSYAERTVLVATVLPMAVPAFVRADGVVLLGLQSPTRSGDASRDLAAALELGLAAEPGSRISLSGLPGSGPRLQDLLEPEPLAVAVHPGFEFWAGAVPDPGGELAAAIERADASVVPTVRLGSVEAAYWCQLRERCHLRWVLPHDEEPLLDAMARLAGPAGGGRGLGVGEGSRYVGSFRAHGLLVPVWDVPDDVPAAAYDEPAASFAARLEAALAEPRPLTDAERRVRAGLVGRQLTLR